MVPLHVCVHKSVCVYVCTQKCVCICMYLYSAANPARCLEFCGGSPPCVCAQKSVRVNCALRMSKGGLPLSISKRMFGFSIFHLGHRQFYCKGSMDLALECRDESDALCVGT